ncbi:unnamed protein product [Phytomonas sp. EM1]|nr:unnamed protein product [Phytomonas sp. EM1]|eukprot:CCW65706.1 unnamed protein product [Phytomonas sp. isolate EM1]
MKVLGATKGGSNVLRMSRKGVLFSALVAALLATYLWWVLGSTGTLMMQTGAKDGETHLVSFDVVSEFFSDAGNFSCPQERYFTREEIAQHITPNDLWIVIDSNVLDVSGFGEMHPGSEMMLLEGAGGRDMAAVFAQFHPPSVVTSFKHFCIGRIINFSG